MSEKIKLKGQLKLPVVGRNPIFAQMKFVKVALSEPDILPDSGSIFTCDEQGNYDFEIYTGKHLLSYNVGNAWSKPIEIIAEPLAEGLESIEISDLIGFQEIPELDATIAALNQQKQELLAIQQDVTDKQAAVTTAAANIDSTVADVEAGYPALLAAQLSKTFYVDKTGLADNTGLTESSPLPDIQSCVSLMSPGGSYTINIGVGTYDTSVGFPAGSSVRIASTSTSAPVSGLISGGQALTEANHTCLLIDRKGSLSRGIFGTNLSFYNILIRSNLSEGDILAAGYKGSSRARIVGADKCSYTVCGYISDDYDEALQASSGAQGNPVVAIGIEGLATSGKIDNVFGGNSTQKNVLILSANSVSINSAGSSGATEVVDKLGYLAVIGA